MCRIFASQLPDTYSYVTRSVRLNGYSTSIKLESKFWRILEEIARSEGMGLPSFLATLHDEVEAIHGEVRNFASLLRCTCLTYLIQKNGLERESVALRPHHAASAHPVRSA
jgi:predicted DNA-binding ribbon-helix-helix protein